MTHTLFWIAVGGAGGTISRFLLGSLVQVFFQGRFPLGTLLVNVSGSFLIGIVFVLLADRPSLDPQWRNILVVGFLGAFTTFSAFSLESVELLEKGHYSLALAYVGSSVLLCLAATAGGLLLARHW